MMNKFFNQNQNDEANELLEALKANSANSNSQFKTSLKQEYLARAKAGSKPANSILSLFNNFNMAMNKNLLATGGLTLVLLVLLAGTTVYLYRQGNDRNSLGLSDREILAKIVENNPQNINRASANNLVAESDSKMAAGGAADVAAIGPSYDFKYSYYKTIYNDGPAVSKCESSYSYPGSDIYKNTISESHSYYDGSTYFGKTVTTNLEGELISYSLSNSRESYTYNGGKYAVKFEYPEAPVYSEPAVLEKEAASNTGNSVEGSRPVESEEMMIAEPISGEVTVIIREEGEGVDPEAPVTDPTVTEVEPIETEAPAEPTKPDLDEMIRNMFGEDVEVDVVEENGKQMVLVISKYDEGECMIAFDSAMGSSLRKNSDEQGEQGDMILNLNYVDVNTFQIEKTERYTNEVKDENLLDTTSTEIENSNADFEEVEDNFEFEYDVEVRTKKYGENDYSNYLKTLNAELTKYVNANPSKFLTPVTSGETTLTGISVTKLDREISERDPFNTFYQDRDFYADTPFGQKLYDTNIEIHRQSINPVGYTPSDAEVSFVELNSKGDTYIILSIFSNENSLEEVEDQVVGYAYDKIEYGKYEVNEENTEIDIDGQKIMGKTYKIRYEEATMPSNDGAELLDRLTIAPYSSTNYVMIFSYQNNHYVVNISNQVYDGSNDYTLTEQELNKFTKFQSSSTVFKNAFNEYIKNSNQAIHVTTEVVD